MKQRSVKNTRKKGRAFVLKIINRLRNELDSSTYEVSGSGAALDKGDIRVPLADLVIEAKDWKKISMANWVKQSEKEGLQHSKTAVMWKHPESPSDNPEIRVDISLEYFIDILKRYSEPKIKEPDRDMKRNLIKLKNAINQVSKDL